MASTLGLRVLVAYGTKNGSTAGIADMIGTALIEEGVPAEVRPADEAGSVEEYDAVILGGALYAGHWHRDARRFARRHAKALQGRPVWLFSSGPLDTSADSTEIPPVGQAARAAQQLGARQHVTFGGRLTDQARGFIARSMVRNGKGGDFRNPARVDGWSRSIVSQLRATAVTSTHRGPRLAARSRATPHGDGGLHADGHVAAGVDDR